MSGIKKDILTVSDRFILSRFSGIRKVLSTSAHNGGIRTGLQAVFNYDGKQGGGEEIQLIGGTYESHMRCISEILLGIPAHLSTGMMTAADMKNAAFREYDYDGLNVRAIVTAGIDHNAGRAGDPAIWQEHEGIWKPAPPLGTVNIIVLIGAALTDGAMARALITCTEAKTAAIQELSLPSLFSDGLATGSGTDGCILVADMESSIHLTEAGKHCKLGELTGRAVKEAVREALFRQSGACAKRQANVFRRLSRFGITRELLWQTALNMNLPFLKKQIFLDQASVWASLPHSAAWAALQAHLMDEYHWGMMTSAIFTIAENALWNGFFKTEKGAVLAESIVSEILKSFA